MAQTRLLKGATAAALLALLVTGCGSSGGTTGGSDAGQAARAARRDRASATGEGAINILAWAGYAEDGTTDQTVNWVTPFEDADRLQGQGARSRTPPTRCSRRWAPASSTSCRRPVTPRCA